MKKQKSLKDVTIKEEIFEEVPKVREAYRRVLLDHGWLAPLVLNLELEAYEGPKNPIGTASVDGRKIRYSPKFVEQLSPSQCTALILHEALHAGLLHLHPARLGERNAIGISPEGQMVRLSNIAQDFVVNDIIVQVGLDLPPNGCQDEKYRGWNWERVYDQILSEIPESQKISFNSMDGHLVAEGEGADAQEQAKDLEKMARQWKDAMADAMALGKMQGKITNDMELALNGAFKEQVPWQKLLAEFLARTLGKNDYTYKRPSRRGRALGLCLPSTYKEAIDSIVFCWDTSGSMFNEEDLRVSIGNTISALQQFHIEEAWLIQGDTEVKSCIKLISVDDVPKVPKGGGGTDFRPLLTKAASLNPTIVVFFTDLYGTFPDIQPVERLLWVTRSKGVKVPFGDVFLVED